MYHLDDGYELSYYFTIFFTSSTVIIDCLIL